MEEHAGRAATWAAREAIGWPIAAVALVLASGCIGAMAQGKAEAASASAPAPVQQTVEPPAGATRLAETVSTGSRLPAAEVANLQDVRIYPREVIERSGQGTISEFLATRPEVSLASPENATGGTTVRPWGAIFGSPLVLINGRTKARTLREPAALDAARRHAAHLTRIKGDGRPRWM